MLSFVSPVINRHININNGYSPPRLQRETRVINREMVHNVMDQSSRRKLQFEDILVKNESKLLDFQGTFTCSICLLDEPYSIGKKLKCNHIFHGNCIHTWLSFNNTCPNCRMII